MPRGKVSKSSSKPSNQMSKQQPRKPVTERDQRATARAARPIVVRKKTLTVAKKKAATPAVENPNSNGWEGATSDPLNPATATDETLNNTAEPHTDTASRPGSTASNTQNDTHGSTSLHDNTGDSADAVNDVPEFDDIRNYREGSKPITETWMLNWLYTNIRKAPKNALYSKYLRHFFRRSLQEENFKQSLHDWRHLCKLMAHPDVFEAKESTTNGSKTDEQKLRRKRDLALTEAGMINFKKLTSFEVQKVQRLVFGK